MQEDKNECPILKNQSWPESRIEIGEGGRVWKVHGLDLISTYCMHWKGHTEPH